MYLTNFNLIEKTAHVGESTGRFFRATKYLFYKKILTFNILSFIILLQG